MTSLYINSRCFISACPPPVMILFIKWPATHYPQRAIVYTLYVFYQNLWKSQRTTGRTKVSNEIKRQHIKTKRNTAKRNTIKTKRNDTHSLRFVSLYFFSSIYFRFVVFIFANCLSFRCISFLLLRCVFICFWLLVQPVNNSYCSVSFTLEG